MLRFSVVDINKLSKFCILLPLFFSTALWAEAKPKLPQPNSDLKLPAKYFRCERDTECAIYQENCRLPFAIRAKYFQAVKQKDAQIQKQLDQGKAASAPCIGLQGNDVVPKCRRGECRIRSRDDP